MKQHWQPYIVGHRGARGIAPENTLPAFQIAANLRLPRAELDVRLSADRHLVVIHNATVNDSTDGEGRVSEMTLDELKELDAAAKWSPRYQGIPIPTLDEVLKQFGTTFHWHVELKSDENADVELLARTATECIRWHRVEKATITSGSEDTLRYVALAAPDTSRGLIIGSDVEARGEKAFQIGCTTVCVNRELLRGAAVGALRKFGLFLVGWTGNSPEELAQLRDAEVDAISTDRPDIALEWLRNNRIRPRLRA